MAIWLYTLFVGVTPTVIRAAVMGTIVVRQTNVVDVGYQR